MMSAIKSKKANGTWKTSATPRVKSPGVMKTKGSYL
jgi:hypothetical protein